MTKTARPTWLQDAIDKRREKNRRSWVQESVYLNKERKKSRAKLVRTLGGKCSCCGSTRRLCFYRPRAGGVPAGSLSVYARLRLYWSLFLAGNLELVCRRCLYALQRSRTRD